MRWLGRDQHSRSILCGIVIKGALAASQAAECLHDAFGVGVRQNAVILIQQHPLTILAGDFVQAGQDRLCQGVGRQIAAPNQDPARPTLRVKYRSNEGRLSSGLSIGRRRVVVLKRKPVQRRVDRHQLVNGRLLTDIITGRVAGNSFCVLVE